jgi:CDP-2,3-bis-(O-geranylgeranyl)-sn-glycerol synthase
MGLIEVVVTAVWAMLPAYLPNNVAVIAGGGPPIDGGRTWRGARLLGDGKTWRGLAAGTLAGLLVAVGLTAVAPSAGDALGVAVPSFPLAAAVALPAGALLGDIAASFVKRRTGRARGASFPLVDQLDLVVGAVGLAYLGAPAWAQGVFTLPVLAAVVVITPVLHLLTNGIGYALGLKQEPW